MIREKIMTQMPLRAALQGFLRDEHGSISIEFCLVFPLLLFITTNGLAFWDAFQSNSKTAKVAYAISDIMSRYDVVDATDTAYLFALQNKMLPLDLTEQTMRITSICYEDGLYRVMWSYTANSGDTDALDPLTDETIPLTLMPALEPQDSVILTEVAAHWEPHLHVGVQPMTWRSALVTTPRFKKMIPHTALNGSNICPDAPPPST
jgi:Flp pilus assembly protein TadG